MTRWMLMIAVIAVVGLCLGYAAAQPPDAPPSPGWGRGPARGQGLGRLQGQDAGQRPGPIHEMFLEADKNDDGQVTYEELLVVAPNFPKARFEALDRNKDGVLSHEDRPLRARPSGECPPEAAELGARGPRGRDFGDPDSPRGPRGRDFGDPDAPRGPRGRNFGDPDGSRGPVPQGPPLERLRAADKNDDRQVTREEFRAEFTDAADLLFDRLDRDGDGVLTPADRPGERPGGPEGRGRGFGPPDGPGGDQRPPMRPRNPDRWRDAP